MDADGFVDCGCGHRHWGLAGAAGVLAWRGGEILAQHRATWSMHGGTWGLPGGAIGMGETPVEGALREAAEEAGMLTPRIWAATTMHHPDWFYTTVIAEAAAGQRARATDRESIEISWQPWSTIDQLELMPPMRDLLPVADLLLGRSLLVDPNGEVDSRLVGRGVILDALPGRIADPLRRALALAGGRRSVWLLPEIAAEPRRGYRYVISASEVDWQLAAAAPEIGRQEARLPR